MILAIKCCFRATSHALFTNYLMEKCLLNETLNVARFLDSNPP